MKKSNKSKVVNAHNNPKKITIQYKTAVFQRKNELRCKLHTVKKAINIVSNIKHTEIPSNPNKRLK